MERKRIITITLVCVLFCEHQRIFGTDVNVRVKPGDNVTIFCDCVIPAVNMIWIRNESYANLSSILMSAENWFSGMFPRFSFVLNSSTHSFDLHIANVSIYDEGIYYCAEANKEITEVNGMLESSVEYQYGNRKTHLAVLDSIPASTEPPVKTDPSNNMTLWMLLGSLCPVCLILCFICICCLCQQKKNTASGVETQARNRHDEENDVHYASINTASIQKQPRRSPRSDFSTYSEVRFKRT
ncbi:uncharacterized protein LOC130553640 [Triplophysa rosa]|uniref:uncharacterized protein LOC130553640 n=1 Tax=Triplophysa rosa TaxID=992332 RepID=UPI002545E0A5|nr:uncharacterized protein LOC130553640 [Triplophysa rosa]